MINKFEFDEASHGAVCVDAAQNVDHFRAYHGCAGGEARMAILPTSGLRYASLGSSHNNQVLRNVLGRGVVNGCPEAVCTDGRLGLTLVEVHDFALAEACRNTSAWEIISHALDVDEKDAALCVQAASNDQPTSFYDACA